MRMIIICNSDAPYDRSVLITSNKWGLYISMLQINPKKFKHIENKTIPSPLRPKFRNKNATNIYFFSKKRVDGQKKDLLIKRIKILVSVLIVGVGCYFLSS